MYDMNLNICELFALIPPWIPWNILKEGTMNNLWCLIFGVDVNLISANIVMDKYLVLSPFEGRPSKSR